MDLGLDNPGLRSSCSRLSLFMLKGRKPQWRSFQITLCLLDTPREYIFQIDYRQDPPILHIPGDHRGPDLCFPDRPEQEEWLHQLTQFVTPYWYCQWKFKSIEICDKFVAYLRKIDVRQSL